jgi:transcriptional regulator with XRE-family HTH domain
MSISEERQAFAERLQSALRQARQAADSPTALARGFNSRFPGRAITVHAARKWLIAESIPTQDKLRTLAQWLQVPAEWLRFGGALSNADGEGRPPVDHSLGSMLAAMSREDLKLVEALHALEAEERRLVRELVQLFFRTQERLAHSDAEADADADASA